MDKHEIIESLLYTAGDEGLDEKQLLEILEINQAKLSELISSYMKRRTKNAKAFHDKCENTQ
ncbi:hypothetical protein ACR0RE_11375, partial [Staphylococcus haemolyticus]